MKIRTAVFLILVLLTTPVFAAEKLKANISVSKNEFSVAEQMEFSLTIENIANKPVRLIKPEVFINNWDPRNNVEFMIVDSEGRSFKKIPHGGTGGILDMPSEAYSLLLEPGVVSKTAHSLYTEDDFGSWSFEYPSQRAKSWRPGEEPMESVAFLPAGKYRIRLKYYFPKKIMTPRWSRELSSKYGEPWHGELLSNEIEINVRPATEESVAKEVSKINYSDGINKQEAIALAQKYLIDKGLNKNYDLSGIAHASGMVPGYKNTKWAIWFRAQSEKSGMKSRIIVDKVSGEAREEWGRVDKYLNKADIKLYFVNWDDIRVEKEMPETDTCKKPCINYKLIKVNLEETLNTFTGKKKLAVVTILHESYNCYSDPKSEIARLEEIIKKHGFEKVVFISEAAMGPGKIIRE
jgi:hypothetical protein